MQISRTSSLFLALCLIIVGVLFVFPFGFFFMLLNLMGAVFAFALAAIFITNRQARVQAYLKGRTGVLAVVALAIFSFACAVQAYHFSIFLFVGEPSWMLPLDALASILFGAVAVAGFIACGLILKAPVEVPGKASQTLLKEAIPRQYPESIALRVIGVLLGLVVAGCGVVVLKYMAGQVSSHYYGLAQVIYPTMGALILFLIAALLAAPRSIMYKIPWIHVAAFFFGILLAIGGILGIIYAVGAYSIIFGAAGFLACVSALLILIKAFRARKLI